MKKPVTSEELVQWLEREIERYRTGPVIAYIAEGHTVEQAAEKFSLTLNNVRRIVRLVREGRDKKIERPSKLRNIYEATVRVNNVQDDKIRIRDELTRLASAGATLRDMAVAIKKSPDYTRDLCYRYGLKYDPGPKAHRPVRVRRTPGIKLLPQKTIDEVERQHQRSKISAVINNDKRIRTPSNVSLPHLSILDGVEW